MPTHKVEQKTESSIKGERGAETVDVLKIVGILDLIASGLGGYVLWEHSPTLATVAAAQGVVVCVLFFAAAIILENLIQIRRALTPRT